MIRAALAALLILCAGVLRAGAVEAIFTLPAGQAELPVTWAAVPAEGSDPVAGAVLTTEPRAGPWIVELVPGPWIVSAYAEGLVFEARIDLAGPGRHEIPPLALSAPAAYRCEGDAPCEFLDAPSGLSFRLPPGWAAEVPPVAEGPPQAVFFAETAGAEEAVWFLNPADWSATGGETAAGGPCRGDEGLRLCSFAETPAALEALAVILPGLSVAR
jgi:hypothetical protein